MVAYNPSTLGQPVSDGSMLTVGVAAELFLFVLFWVLSALYVRRANTEFDDLTQEDVYKRQDGKKQTIRSRITGRERQLKASRRSFLVLQRAPGISD